MNIDLIGSIELTASATIVIAALAIGFGLKPVQWSGQAMRMPYNCLTNRRSL